MTLWITALTMVSTLTVTGLAFAQQPTPQSQQPAAGDQERGTGVSMTNPTTPDGSRIMINNLPPVERWRGTSMTNPTTPDGKEITGSTSFGQR